MNTLAQRRAMHALGQIAAIKQQPDHRQILYRSYVEGLPATILQAGLGQAMASLLARAKGDSEHGRYAVYASLESWLCGDDPDAPFLNNPPTKTSNLKLINALAKCDPSTYLRAHAEALAYLEWLKKFAAAELKRPDPGSNIGDKE